MKLVFIFILLLVHVSSYANYVRVDQGWDQKDRDLVYTLSEGAEIMPLKWFLNLRRAQDDKLLKESLEDYGFVFDKATSSKKNPHGLPIGVTTHSNKATAHLYGESQWVGVNCTACHTAQIDFGKHKLVVDGGPSLFRLQNFEADIISSVRATLGNKKKLDKFLAETKTSTSETASVIKNLKLFEEEFASWVERSHKYVDSKGREIKAGVGRIDGLGGPTNDLTCSFTPRMGDPKLNALFSDSRNCQSAHPAVSLPHLWGITDMDWVQWDGSVHFSLARNFGQATGTYGKNWVELNSFGSPVMKSTARIRELMQIESHYKKLRSPEWTQLVDSKIVESLDRNRLMKGKVLYEQNCLSCHAVNPETTEIHKTYEPNAYWVTPVYKTSEIGVDAYYTNRNAGRKAFIPPGIKKNYGMLLSQEEKESQNGILVSKLRALNIVIMSFTSFTDHKKLNSSLDLLSNLMTLNPLALPTDVTKTFLEYTGCRNILRKQKTVGLRARSLEGIGFTAPYLHNGSVPTLYDLLLPAKKRPVTFKLGCRKYDPVRLGYDCSDSDKNIEIFDTRLETNSNVGHEYGTQLSHEERLDLIEYVKSLKNPRRPARISPCY